MGEPMLSQPLCPRVAVKTSIRKHWYAFTLMVEDGREAITGLASLYIRAKKAMAA
jgi:hypothetical protein